MAQRQGHVQEPRIELQKAWTETSHGIAALLDDKADSGPFAALTFESQEDVAAPYINRGVRPRIAILREQGAARSK